jgi:ankyrin repeat protein
LQGCDVNLRNNEGWSAIFHGVKAGNPATVRHLLASGADVHAPDAAGFTVVNRADEFHAVTLAELISAEGPGVGIVAIYS